jgi:hypothetical protein
MVLWNDLVNITPTPVRFQIPRFFSEDDITEFGTILVENLPDSFLEWFKGIEKELCKDFPTYDSKIGPSGIHVKCIQGFTQYFDSAHQLIFDDTPPSLKSATLDCIVEVNTYGPFNGRYGISLKMYQCCIVNRVMPECLI